MSGRILMAVLGATALAALAVRANSDAGRLVATLSTGGEAKTVALSGAPVARVRVRCVEGAAIINTVSVLEGEAKATFQVARRLAAGEEHIIELNPPRNATALRISDAARGRYEVYVAP